jgi:hypothetical protein
MSYGFKVPDCKCFCNGDKGKAGRRIFFRNMKLWDKVRFNRYFAGNNKV